MRVSGETAKLVRGIAQLSVGTFVIQGLGAVGQVVFAIWLHPVDYGLWATATASMVLFTGLVNLGEVNAYLTSQVTDLNASRRAIWRTNCALMLGGGVVVTAYALTGHVEVAVLVALTALNLPLLGESNLLYAAYVKQRRNGSLIRAQATSSVLRMAVGVVVAWMTGSALAFAVSMICYSVAMIVVLRVPSEERASHPYDQPAVRPRSSFKWSVHSLSQIVPTQVDYLVISLVATRGLLGIYYLSYQITVALAALVGGPLSKTALSALGTMDGRRRRELGARLMAFAAGGIGVLVCVGVVVVQPLAGVLPATWRDAVPTVCILLASLPARFLTFVTDAVLMADDRWWQSARLNGVDALGTALAALIAVQGQILAVAVAVVTWQVCFSAVRVHSSLGGARSAQRLLLIVATFGAAALLTTGVLLSGGWLWALAALSALVSSVPLATLSRTPPTVDHVAAGRGAAVKASVSG